jgi:phosphoglycerol transferase
MTPNPVAPPTEAPLPEARSQGRAVVRILIPGVLLTGACLLILALLNPRYFSLNIPYYYLTPDTKFPWLSFDVNLYLAYFKNIVDGHWLATMPRLGAPGEMSNLPYPTPYFQLHLYVLGKGLSLLGLSVAKVVNLLFLFTFPAIALSAYALFRQHQLSPAISGAMGLLFAFLPYHFHTGQMHMALASYACVPLAVLVALWVVQGEFFQHTAGKLRLNRHRLGVSVLISVFIASSDLYYAIYSTLLLSVAVVMAGLSQPKRCGVWRAMLPGLVCVGTLVLTLAAILLPVWQYRLTANTLALPIERVWQHTEFWGLKIAQLLLPVREHFVGGFAEVAKIYSEYPHAHVNEAVALGVIASAGFLFLLLNSLLPLSVIQHRFQPLVSALKRWNLFFILFATVSGFATWLALFLPPLARANYRVSVFLALFALFVVGILLQQLKESAWLKHRPVVFGTLLVAITLVGLYDQTGTLATLPTYTSQKGLANANQATFQQLEASLPPGSAVLQLPLASFPEGGDVDGIKMYEHFIPFLHTHTLRWSYGAVKGGPVDRWLHQVVTLPLPQLEKALCEKGFSAILLDRNGYTTAQAQTPAIDLWPELTQAYSKQVGVNGRYVAFTLCTPKPEHAKVNP